MGLTSARSGMEKTKATAQEKVDKMRAHDESEKQKATEKKMERMGQAELGKQEVREHNAVVKQDTAATGAPGHTTATTGAHPMSAIPGHTGEPAGGYAVDGSEKGITRPRHVSGSTYTT